MNFHFIRMCVFIFPEPLARGYKHTTSFIYIVWNENSCQISFYHMLHSQKRKNTLLLSFITDFTVEKVPM